MATILGTTDFIDVAEYFCIPSLRFPHDINRLNGCIKHSEAKFIFKYGFTVKEISDSNTLKDALKYFTFAEWLRSEWLEKTGNGASVQKEQVKGQPKYDLTREVEARNTAIDLINSTLPDDEEPFLKYYPFMSY